jgi:hypothetical protein
MSWRYGGFNVATTRNDRRRKNGYGAARPAAFELTVEGSLGPVLRHALKPHTVSNAQACTVFSAAVPESMDLVDLVLALQARGLQLDGIVCDDDPVHNSKRSTDKSPGNQS